MYEYFAFNMTDNTFRARQKLGIQKYFPTPMVGNVGTTHSSIV